MMQHFTSTSSTSSSLSGITHFNYFCFTRTTRKAPESRSSCRGTTSVGRDARSCTRIGSSSLFAFSSIFFSLLYSSRCPTAPTSEMMIPHSKTELVRNSLEPDFHCASSDLLSSIYLSLFCHRTTISNTTELQLCALQTSFPRKQNITKQSLSPPNQCCRRARENAMCAEEDSVISEVKHAMRSQSRRIDDENPEEQQSNRPRVNMASD